VPERPRGDSTEGRGLDFLPIFLSVRGRPCLVVGGGEVGARKVEILLAAGALVTVVSPDLCRNLHNRLAEGRIVHRKERFRNGNLDGFALAMAATNDRAVNRQVAMLANEHQIPVNLATDPACGSFQMPAIIDRSPLLIAVSTGGSSPVLARLIRGRLESLIPAAYGRLAILAGEYRERVRKHVAAGNRRPFWEQVFQGPIAEMVFSGREQGARRALDLAIESASAEPARVGEVYLVGGGPGDPDLLTFRALRLMQQADVVVHDRLVSLPVLELVRRDAQRIDVGKRRANHTLPQEGINDLLVDLAREGKRVLRLKGGDPFIFGRGGEEIETLAAQGIPFQVVPGITAASGCACYAGIPLTHRDHAHSCVFVTGNLEDGVLHLDWHVLAQPKQTVVVYMGLVGLDQLRDQLVARGVSGELPAAIVEQGTTPDQRVHVGTLGTLPTLAEEKAVCPPALIILGNVVSLHDQLAWFEPDAGARNEDRAFRVGEARRT